jgi:hypothetical protein
MPFLKSIFVLNQPTLYFFLILLNNLTCFFFTLKLLLSILYQGQVSTLQSYQLLWQDCCIKDRRWHETSCFHLCPRMLLYIFQQ